MQLPHRLSVVVPTLAVVLTSVWLAGCGGGGASQHVKRGDAFVEQKKLPEATIEYRAALQADPNLGEVRMKLAGLHVQLNQPAEALREYVRAADLLPKSVDAQLKSGNFLLLAGRFEDAKTRANNAIALEASSVFAQILLGNALAGLRDVDGAMAEYQQALALNPGEEVAYRNIATLHVAAGHVKEAEVAFRKAVEVAPSSVQARMALASFLWATARASEAEQVLKDALALDPKNLAAIRALGTFYVGSNRMADAEPYFKALAAAESTPDASLALADYYIVAKRFELARPLLQQAVQNKDTYAPAMLRLAAIDVENGLRAEAQAKLHDLLERQPKHMAARLLNARLLVVDGKREAALAQATTIAIEDPQSTVAADAQLLVGSLQAALDRPEDAIKTLEDVLRRRPRTTAAELALARIHLMRGEANVAETYVKDALSSNPKNPVARADMVRVHLAQRNTARAKQELAALETEYPNAPAVLHLVAARQLAENQVPAARATYVRLIQAQPSDVEALNAIVTIDVTTGHKQEALGRVKEALRSLAPTGPLYLVAARTYLAVNDLAQAEATLQKAIEVEPTRLQAYSLLGLLYVRQHRLADATANFRQIVTRNPSSVSGGTMLGMLYEAQGQTSDAEKEYRRVLALDPESPVAANNLAWIYVAGNQNLSEAAALAKVALRRLPDEPNVNDTLGWIYYRQGETGLAIKHLEASVAKDPSMAANHYHLGMAYARYSEPDKARVALTKALSFKTEFDGIAEARATLAALPN